MGMSNVIGKNDERGEEGETNERKINTRNKKGLNKKKKKKRNSC